MTSRLTPLLEAAARAPIVPVIVVTDVAQAVPLAEALIEGGLGVAEVTLRTSAGIGAIKAMKDAHPRLIVGAGTVLTGDDAKACRDAGADFLVSPGMTPGLRKALGDDVGIMVPGVGTISEAMARNEEGFELLKLFPAAVAGGVGALKSFHGPLPHLKFMPTGGVSLANVAEYFALPNVFAVGGTWVASLADVEAGNWTGIANACRDGLRAIG